MGEYTNKYYVYIIPSTVYSKIYIINHPEKLTVDCCYQSARKVNNWLLHVCCMSNFTIKTSSSISKYLSTYISSGISSIYKYIPCIFLDHYPENILNTSCHINIMLQEMAWGPCQRTEEKPWNWNWYRLCRKV
jgi:hypothetical protein